MSENEDKTPKPIGLTPEDFAASEKYNGDIAPWYFASNRIAKALCAEAITEETMKALAENVAKEVSGAIFDAVSDFLWSGSFEDNMGLMADQLVDDVLEAVVSGNEVLARRIALKKYDQHGVRAAIARLIPDEVLQARIADLEREVAELKESRSRERMYMRYRG